MGTLKRMRRKQEHQGTLEKKNGSGVGALLGEPPDPGGYFARSGVGAHQSSVWCPGCLPLLHHRDSRPAAA